MFVRKAKVSDVFSLVKLYRAAPEVDNVDLTMHTAAFFKWLIQSRGQFVFVVDYDGVVVAGMDGDWSSREKSVHLNNIVVSEKMRGKGVGKLLFAKLEEFAREKKCKRILTEVYDWNKGMLGVMEHYGYNEFARMAFFRKDLK